MPMPMMPALGIVRATVIVIAAPIVGVVVAELVKITVPIISVFSPSVSFAFLIATYAINANAESASGHCSIRRKWQEQKECWE